MKCPKCGSENVQYATKTSGGGISAGDSCLGYLLLGPLGLLCGACGSGTTTEEFWVCRDCGNRFSIREGKKQVQKEKDIAEKEKDTAEYYERSRAELAALPEEDRDPEKTAAAYNAALGRQGEAEAAYQKLLDGLKEKGDAMQRRYIRRINGKVWGNLTAILAVIGFVLLFLVTPLGIAILAVSLPLYIIYEIRQSSAKKALLAGSEELREAKAAADSAKQEASYYKAIIEKRAFVKAYEEKQAKK